MNPASKEEYEDAVQAPQQTMADLGQSSSSSSSSGSSGSSSSSSSGDSEAESIDANKAAAETIADHVLGDQPAGTEKDDKLGFAPYVRAVAGFLTDSSTKTPLTLSIEGLWGSGKSSFMLQLEEALKDPRLKDRRKTKVVRFNAWQYDSEEGLWAAFINEFGAKLNKTLKWDEKIRARGRLIALRLSWQDWIETAKAVVWLVVSLLALGAIVSYLLHGGIATFNSFLTGGEAGKSATKTLAVIGGTGGTVAVLLLFFNQLKDLFKSPASLDKTVRLFARPNYSDRLPFIQQVTRDFASLVTAYAGEDDVYVFVDDLDRCEYSRAAELMQALLMLLSSSPKIALIVGLDRDKVAAAMATRQEKLLPYLYKVQPAEAYKRGMEYGQRFIEKFIQLSYILPTPRSDSLKAMVNPDVEAPNTSVPESEKSARAIEIVTGKNDSETLNIMIDMAHLVFDHNPRNVKQFVNMFRLQAFIANETGLFGSLRVTGKTGRPLTIQQLGKFVALCMRWPDFVDAASANPGLAGDLEKWLEPRAGGEGPPSDEVNLWLGNERLRLLLKFGMPSPDFSLAEVNFKVLTEITPARAKSSSEGRAPASTASDSSSEHPRTESSEEVHFRDDRPFKAEAAMS